MAVSAFLCKTVKIFRRFQITLCAKLHSEETLSEHKCKVELCEIPGLVCWCKNFSKEERVADPELCIFSNSCGKQRHNACSKRQNQNQNKSLEETPENYQLISVALESQYSFS